MLQEFQLMTKGPTKLAAAVVTPDHTDRPTAIVQLIHGALEHKERYFSFASYLAERGYVVVMIDNRGHGRSVSAADPFGIMHSWQQQVSDQVVLSKWIKQRYPNRPLFLFGHSLGSIWGRLYLQHDDELIDGLILTGTVRYIPVVPVGILLEKFYQRVRGATATSTLLSRLSGMGPGDHDWLTYNRENINRVIKDPLMMDQYPVSSLLTVWLGDFQLKQTAHFACRHRDLPILSITGDHDKFTGGRRGLRDTVRTLNRIGYQNVTSIVMPHMKHEVLNETGHEKVYALIYQFLRQHQA